jgi:hypothetical protein
MRRGHSWRGWVRRARRCRQRRRSRPRRHSRYRRTVST